MVKDTAVEVGTDVETPVAVELGALAQAACALSSIFWASSKRWSFDSAKERSSNICFSISLERS